MGRLLGVTITNGGLSRLPGRKAKEAPDKSSCKEFLLHFAQKSTTLSLLSTPSPAVARLPWVGRKTEPPLYGNHYKISIDSRHTLCNYGIKENITKKRK